MLWYQTVFAKEKKWPKVITVDFDGTIAEDGYPSIGRPMPNVRESLQKLMDAGFEIVLFSARLRRNDGRPKDEPERQRKKIEAWMEENEIPYTRIDDGYDGKPHCDFIVDNKALHYGGKDDWESIVQHILSKEK